MEYNITSKFKHPNSATTLNKTSCVATKYSNIFKPDYMLFIFTRNQLSSVVKEGTEAGATVMEQGVTLLAKFPLSSPFFFSLQKYANVLENTLISRESLF